MKRYIKQLLGWSLMRLSFKTDRKIVVIESDDWGSVRMSSRAAYQFLFKKGYEVDACPYNRYDMLESNTDLDRLFDVLLSYRDRYDHHPIITANMVVANPDFQKIRDSGYESYFYEPFTETLKRYPDHCKVYDLYRNGIESKIFYPQFHGREHVNIKNWLKALRTGQPSAVDGFSHNMFSLHAKGVSSARNEFLDAFGHEFDLEFGVTIEEGLALFKALWGFSADSFIAPCYVWSQQLEQILANNGVYLIQGNYVQRVPAMHRKRGFKKKYHYCGERNKYGQRYLVRNVAFEPALVNNSETEIIDNCLHGIEMAFRLKTPAIICSHRLNYMGGVDPVNREKNLRLLSTLLMKIIKAFPEVEFRTSDSIFN